MFQQWPSLCKKNFSPHIAALFSLYGLHKKCTKSRHQVTRATIFWTVAPNICRFSVKILLHVTLPAPTILMWLLVFWRICAPLAYTQCTQFIPQFDMMLIIQILEWTVYQELHSTPFVWQTSNSKMSRSMCRLQCCHVVNPYTANVENRVSS